jgi:adenylate kinase
VTRIVITGNPGVGKHTIGVAVAKKLNYTVIDLNKFVIMNDATFKSSPAAESSLDVNVRVASHVLKKELNKGENLVIIGHLAPYLLRSNQVDFVAILRKYPKHLIQVYKKRKYSVSKIKENITCEILGTCSYDVLSQFDRAKIAEFDTSTRSTSEMVRVILQAVNTNSRRSFGIIDWISKIENEREILNLILT